MPPSPAPTLPPPSLPGEADLRDLFASSALSGLLAARPESLSGRVGTSEANGLALDAYVLADAMLRERARR